MNLLLILSIASLIAKTPYDSLKYNCWDYATDLRLALAKQNITSRIITGIVDCNSGLFNFNICKAFGGAHDWLDVNGVWIEATSGELITDRSGYRAGYYSFNKFNPYKQKWKELNT